MTFSKSFLWATVCTALIMGTVSAFAQVGTTTPPATGTTTPPATGTTTPPATGTTTPPVTGTTTPPATDAGASSGSASTTPTAWSAAVDGVSGTRQLSPTGDILDSNMDALSPLSLDSINIPAEQLTIKNLVDVKKASTIIKKALYLPLDKEERAKLTPNEVLRIRNNQRIVLQQVSTFFTTFGITSAQNVSDFQKRKDTAATFIPSAENERESIQVLTGLTLGQFAETNKMLALTASLALLEAADVLSSSSNLSGD